MKKLLLFSLSFALLIILSAQESPPVLEFNNQSMIDNDDFILKQDYDMIWDYSESIWEHTRNVVYDYNEFNKPIEKYESWTDGRGPYKRTDLYYDNATNQYLEEERAYLYSDSAWVKDSKSLYYYDANNKRIQKIWQTHDGEQYVNEIKNDYAYDVNDNKIWSMMYYWEDGAWAENQEFDYQYDENGYLYKIESIAWVDEEWIKWQKSIYAYDTSNLLLSIESSKWDVETSGWLHPHHKQLYTYDQDNNRIIFIIQGWNEFDEFWYNQYKTTYYYLPVGNEVEKHVKSGINKSIENFETTEDEINIDPGREGKVLTGIEVLLDSVLHTSVGDLEITLTHNGISVTIVSQTDNDGDNFITTKLSDQGVDTLAKGIAPFYGIYKPENSLSAFLETEPAGTWTLSIYDGVEGNTGTLKSWGLNLIYASGVSAIEDVDFNKSDLVVYPNPASSVCNLQPAVFSLQSSIVQVYDLNGKKLLEQHFPKGTSTPEIDVSELKNGIYFCKISSGRYSTTQKLIIQK